MHRPTNLLRVAFSLLLQGILIMSDRRKSAAEKKTFRNQPCAQTPPTADGSQPLTDILRYISTGWNDLTRTMTRCESLTDIKTDQEPVLFLPADFPRPPALSELQKHCNVRVENLPNRIAGLGESRKIDTNGLLYLENPYVVPGGQFNEMYGWDSYFIIRGLLRDHRPDLAKGMVENFFYEIDHYGGLFDDKHTPC